MTPFRKMQGLGNDFAVFDARTGPVLLTPERAKRVADRHFGIGCDTVVLILPGSVKSDATLRFFNADGGEAGACGNATRCVARLLMDERGLARVRLESNTGSLLCSDAGNGLVTVDMGKPGLEWNEIPLSEAKDTAEFQFALEGRTLTASAVSMGNPHCVLFVGDAEKAPVAHAGVGARRRHHPGLRHRGGGDRGGGIPQGAGQPQSRADPGWRKSHAGMA
jgi:diaminopimelate epimerase